MCNRRSLLFCISCMAAALVLSSGQHKKSHVVFYRVAEDQTRQLKRPFQEYQRNDLDLMEFEESSLQDYRAVDPPPRLSSPFRPGPIENFRRPPVHPRKPITSPPHQIEVPPTSVPQPSPNLSHDSAPILAPS